MAGGPARHPCSDTGRLESDIDRLANEVHRKADSHEISTLNSNVAHLERANEELSSICDGLRSRLETCEEKIEEIFDAHLNL